MASNPYKNNGGEFGNKNAQKKFDSHDKQRAEPAPLTPADTAATALARAAARYQKKVTFASLGSQAQVLREQFRASRLGIYQQGRETIDAMLGQSQNRGTFGSSQMEGERQDILQTRDAALQEAFQNKQQGMLAIQQGKLDAIVAYRNKLAEIAMQTAAAKQQNSIDLYGGPTHDASDYQIDTSGAGGNGVTTGSYFPNLEAAKNDPWAQKLSRATNLIGLARRIERLGFNVAGLEGFQGVSEITSGHIRNSNHYGPPGPNNGTAMDISGGNLNKLYDVLLALYGGHGANELLYRDRLYNSGSWFTDSGLTADHMTHIHFSMDDRRWQEAMQKKSKRDKPGGGGYI